MTEPDNEPVLQAVNEKITCQRLTGHVILHCKDGKILQIEQKQSFSRHEIIHD